MGIDAISGGGLETFRLNISRSHSDTKKQMSCIQWPVGSLISIPLAADDISRCPPSVAHRDNAKMDFIGASDYPILTGFAI
jgi:hypothetical protein